MPYLHRNNKLIFASSREVVTYYTGLIDQLTPQLQGVTLDDYQAVRSQIVELRRELIEQLKNFGHSQVDEYFKETMTNAETGQELYELSNAYEALLLAELNRIKVLLYTLRTT